MKRIFTFFALLCIGFSAATAQVVISEPGTISEDYTGKIELTFSPDEGDEGMLMATECYSHIGLLTDKSVDSKDWKYIKEDGFYGQPIEPKWTRVGGVWKLEITDFRSWFGCPAEDHIRGIAMVFHNGKWGEEGFMEGKAVGGADIILPVNVVLTETPDCYYYLEMWDAYGDRWNGNQIVIEEGLYMHSFEMSLFGSGQEIVKVPSYGGKPTFSHVEGSWPEEVGFAIYASNGEEIIRHNIGSDFSALPYTMTTSPCKSGDIATAVTGLTATVTGVQLDVAWDDNTNVNYWMVSVNKPNGEFFKSQKVEQSSAHEWTYSNIGDAAASGVFNVTVTPYNSSNQALPISATTTFEYNAPAIGNVDLSVLIASDSKFDVTQGVKAVWRIDDYDEEWKELATLTQDGTTRWWKGTVNIPKATFQIGVKSPEIDGVTYYARNNTNRTSNAAICMEVQGRQYSAEDFQRFRLPTVDCSLINHNYIPSDGYNATAPGSVELTIGVPDYAPYYEINLLNGEEVVDSKYITGPSWPLTFTFKNTVPVNVTSWTIQALDGNYDPIGDLKTFEGFTIPASLNVPSGLEVTVNSDRTCTFKWDEPATGHIVDHYTIEVSDESGSTWFYTTGLLLSDLLPATLGKVDYTSTAITRNGELKVRIYAYDNSSNYLGSAEKAFTIEKPLNNITVRVMVPNDNNMAISTGVWLWLWYGGTAQCLPATQDILNPHWYEAIATITGTEYGFLVVNKEILDESSWAGAEQTEDVENVIEANVCYELMYKPEGATKWTLKRQDNCTASNHNYTINNVTWDETHDGYVTLTNVTAANIAPRFALYVREHSTSNPYELVYTGSVGFSWYAQVATDTQYDYQLLPVNWATPAVQLAGMYEGTFTVKANPYAITGLNAVVGTDDVTTTFSWNANANVDHYILCVYDKATDDQIYYITDITTNSVVEPIFFTGTCWWKLELYDASDNYVGEVRGPEFATVKPDVTPQNIQTEMLDKWTAVVTWELPAVVPYCRMNLREVDAGGWYNATLKGKNGHYSFIYKFDEDEKGTFYWRLMPEDNYNDLLDDYVNSATFKIPQPLPQYQLTISAGTGGTVNETVNGKYDEGSHVTITATPDLGFVFVQWSDGSTDASRDIVIDKDTTLAASFVNATTEYTLTLSCNAGGTVSASPEGPTYTVGTPVTITATPDAEHKFVQWNDGNTSASRTINIISDTTFTATFVEKGATYTLTLGTSEHGTVAASPVGPSYEAGTSVTLTATPASGFHFAQWQDGNTENPRTIVMDGNKSFTATFLSDTKYTIKVTAGENGKVKINDGTEKTSVTQEFYGGEVITITAVPDEGYTLDEWSDDDEEKSLSREITVSANLTTKATFRELKKFTLSISIRPAKSGTVKINGEVREENTIKVTEGKSATITAIAAEGFKFKGWELNESIFETASETSILMNKSKDIVAVFEEAQGFENVKAEDAPVQKLLINGQLFILRDGKLYNAAGVLVK